MLMAALTFHSSAATLVVTTTSDSGSGSLRQAILDANATNGLDSIVFQIPGTAPFTITPLAALPAITDPVVIDGTTQPGYTPNHPIIESGVHDLNQTGGETGTGRPYGITTGTLDQQMAGRARGGD